VKAGRELTLGKQEMRKAPEGVLHLDPFVVHARHVEQLEKFEVTGTKEKPYAGANVDIPRTINDVQPYYIFDSKTIDQSGAVSVEDFLKQRLTMNTTALSNGQSAPNATARRRVAGAIPARSTCAGSAPTRPSSSSTAGGWPVSPCKALPISPTSTAFRSAPSSVLRSCRAPLQACYGGSALGGVVNVVLKKNYAGAELR